MIKLNRVNEYDKSIALLEAFVPKSKQLNTNQKEVIVGALLEELKSFVQRIATVIPNTFDEKRRLLHATLNILEPYFYK